eukprot:6065280-Alexandrium_andersonii.AAC.1
MDSLRGPQLWHTSGCPCDGPRVLTKRAVNPGASGGRAALRAPGTPLSSAVLAAVQLGRWVSPRGRRPQASTTSALPLQNG